MSLEFFFWYSYWHDVIELTLLWLKSLWSYWTSLELRGLGTPRAISSLMSLSWSLCSLDLRKKKDR